MKNILTVVIVVVLFYLLYVWVNYSKSNLKNNCIVTTGTITNILWGHKNGRYIIQATFIVNGTSFNTSDFIQCTDIKLEYLCNKLLSKKIIVVYDSTNMNNSQLLIDAKDFKEYNIDMPDSLRWIDSLTTCKK